MARVGLGDGQGGFIAALCGRTGVRRDRVLSVDFNGVGGGDAFFDDLRTRLGATFQQICGAVAEAGPCVLVLDDVDVNSSPLTVGPAVGLVRADRVE